MSVFERVKGKDLAELFNVSPQALGRWASRDGCPRNPDKTYDAKAVLQWFIDRESGAMTSGRSVALEAYRAARASQEQIRLQKMKGELVEEAVFMSWLTDRVIVTRTILMSVGQAVAPAAVGKGVKEIARLIDDRNRMACEEISQEWDNSLIGDEG